LAAVAGLTVFQMPAQQQAVIVGRNAAATPQKLAFSLIPRQNFVNLNSNETTNLHRYFRGRWLF
jgi:ABC-type phosphate/phosphonate transport system substrate-binding protein